MKDYSDFFKALKKHFHPYADFDVSFKEGLFEIQELGENEGELCRIVKTEKSVDINYQYHKKYKEVSDKHRHAKDEKERKKLLRELDKLLDDDLSFYADFFDTVSSLHFSTVYNAKEFKEAINEKYEENFTEKHLLIRRAGKYTIAVNKPWWYGKK
jgi:hypothetical protein